MLIFSFEKGLNSQNHSSSGSHHFLPLLGKPCYCTIITVNPFPNFQKLISPKEIMKFLQIFIDDAQEDGTHGSCTLKRTFL